METAKTTANYEQFPNIMYGLIHDITGPIRSINSTISNILEGRIPSSKINDRLFSIGEATKLTLTILNNFHLLYQIQRGEIKPHFSVEDQIDKLVLSKIQAFSSEAKSRRLKFQLKRLDKQTKRLHQFSTDINLFKHVLDNLINNAIKFSNIKTIILIEYSLIGNLLKLTLTNQGNPIAKSEYKNIFEMFYVGNNATGINKNASGNGLYIAKMLITAIGGSLKVKSSQKQTSFTLELKGK